MEAAVTALRAAEDQDFLRTTTAALKVVQNILNEASEEKYRRLRSTVGFCAKPGVVELLQALGFELRGGYYVLDETFISSLPLKKKELQAARQKTGTILGWDVPFSALKFSTALSSCKYGEVFRGMMDDEEVAVKTLKPDGGEVARESFDRELDLLYKLEHTNLVQLQGVTLTSDPTSIILEYIPTSLLDMLHHSELGDEETASFSLQVASALDYLHSHNILHCDLGARNIRVTADKVVKVCDLGLARQDGSPTCIVSPEREGTLAVRWTAPEVLREHLLTKHADMWSYGVFLYELVTNGSVPYASFSNQQVRSKVKEGYRLPQPHNCPDELYSLMLHCWSPRATERPTVCDAIRNHLKPLKAKASEGKLSRQNSMSDDTSEGKSSTLKSSRSSHKLKVKEASYPQVLSKGGGLLRVYTALISPFHHHVVAVCGKKTTVSEVVQIALAKCGKPELDPKVHSIALVSPQSSESPAHYLGPDERILSMKAQAAASSMFVLCVHTPGPAILEIVNSIKHNPAYGTAFDSRTCGYLVLRGIGAGPGERGGGKQKPGEQRRWCVLDGSSLLCYRDEEDEGVKQFQLFLDVKNSSVAPLGGKKSSTTVRVGTADGGQFIFSASDKTDMLRWIEAIETSSRLEPSTMLLHSGGGVVVQTGFVECQEFALDVGGASPLQSPPPLNRRLGANADFSGTYSAVDYGKHWTVLKSSGLVQCLVRGRPETLFSLLNAKKVKMHNPRDMRDGTHYFISIEVESSRIVLQAECPTDHFDWVLAMERVLHDLGMQRCLCGDRGKESGYVTLKRLMIMQESGCLGDRGSAMQLYAMPRTLNTLTDDLYDPDIPNPQLIPPRERKRLGFSYENQVPPPPPSPPTYVNFIPPPPLPPRSAGAPPLPPKGISKPYGISPSLGTPNDGANSSPTCGEYVFMQPQSVPSTPSGPAPGSIASPPPRSVPTTPNGAHPPPGLGGAAPPLPTQPIMIPNRRPSKQSKLLRSDSEVSSSSSHTLDSSLAETQEWVSPPPSSSSHSRQSSTSRSLPRHASSHSLTSPSSSSSHHHHHHHHHTHRRQVSGNLETSTSSLHNPPSTLPGNHGDGSSGYNSPLLSMSPSPGIRRSQSNRFVRPVAPVPPRPYPEDISQSDGMMVAEAKIIGVHHPVSQAGSVPLSCGASDGYCSSHSSIDDVAQLPTGWRKGYCDTKPFFVNTETGTTTWNIQEVFASSHEKLDKGTADKPGGRWQVVTLENGQVYYYHEVTRQTTWNVQDTFS